MAASHEGRPRGLKSAARSWCRNSTDPKNPDTDGDRILDGEDHCPLEVVNMGPDILLTKTADPSGSQVTLTGQVFESLAEGTARCDADNIVSIAIDWDDGTLVQDLVFTPATDVPVDVSHVYATQEVDTIRVTATDRRGAASTMDFSVDISFPTRNLLAFYPFNNHALDYSCNDRNGTLPGGAATPVPTANRFGGANGAYCFPQDQVVNGQPSTRVNLPHMPVPGAATNSFTLAGWVIPNSVSQNGILAGQENFTALFQGLTGNIGFTVRKPDATYATVMDSSAAPVEIAGDDSACALGAPASDWTFYAGVVLYDAVTMDTTVRLYRGNNAALLDLNGFNNLVTEVGSAVVLAGTTITNPSLGQTWQVLGQSMAFGPVPGHTDTSAGPQARYDDVRIYDDALTLVEINALFNKPNNSAAVNDNGPCMP